MHNWDTFDKNMVISSLFQTRGCGHQAEVSFRSILGDAVQILNMKFYYGGITLKGRTRRSHLLLGGEYYIEDANNTLGSRKQLFQAKNGERIDDLVISYEGILPCRYCDKKMTPKNRREHYEL